jgi:hypothetical protein
MYEVVLMLIGGALSISVILYNFFSYLYFRLRDYLNKRV